MPSLDLEFWIRTHLPDELAAAPPKGPTRRRSVVGVDRSEFWSRVAYNYAIKCSPSIEGKDGHKNAFRVACALIIGFNLPRDSVLPILQIWNRSCQPPWKPWELIRKIEQAEEAYQRHPNPGYLRQNLRKGRSA